MFIPAHRDSWDILDDLVFILIAAGVPIEIYPTAPSNTVIVIYTKIVDFSRIWFSIRLK
jgi:hypothetical protein